MPARQGQRSEGATGGVRGLPARLAVDLSPLRASRDFRLLSIGSFLTGLGTQAALVALPYQVYVQTRSPALTGLLGAVELGPLVAMSLYGGALADRMDRRRLLLVDQLGLVLVSGGLAAGAFAGHPPLLALYVLAGLMAGFGAVANVAETAMVPNLVGPERLRPALALSFGMATLTVVVGPALGGVTIATAGLGATYLLDAVSCLGLVAALALIAPQHPANVDEHPHVLRSIAEGLRFVRSERALMGSFGIDLLAMTFGMPRALFPVLSLTVYHSGAIGTGALFAAASTGATVAAFASGWLSHSRRLGRIVIGAVLCWGAAVALAGLVGVLWQAMVLLALAGAADSVSAVCRSTINQTVTPDVMRGRMSAVFSMVVTGGPRLGDIESGAVASLTTPRFSVLSGGLACIVSAFALALAFPALARFDSERVRGASSVEPVAGA